MLVSWTQVATQRAPSVLEEVMQTKRLGHASMVVGPAGGTLLFLSTPRLPELSDWAPAGLHVSCTISTNLAGVGLLQEQLLHVSEAQDLSRLNTTASQ